VAFLTGVSLALFYVGMGIPLSWIADRYNRRNLLAISITLWSAMTNALRPLAAAISSCCWRAWAWAIGEAGGTRIVQLDHLRLFPCRPPPHGTDDLLPRRADRCVARRETWRALSPMPMAGARRSSCSAFPGILPATLAIMATIREAQARLPRCRDQER